MQRAEKRPERRNTDNLEDLEEPSFVTRERRREKRRVRKLLYTREQSADALSVSISTVIRLEREGRLSKVRLRGESGRVHNPVAEVEALVASCSVAKGKGR